MNEEMKKSCKKVIKAIAVEYAGLILIMFMMIMMFIVLFLLSMQEGGINEFWIESMEICKHIISDNLNSTEGIVKVIYHILHFAIMISILNYTEKAFKAVIKAETPFNEITYKYLQKNTIGFRCLIGLELVYLIPGRILGIEEAGRGFIIICIVSTVVRALTYIFEYGYKLQKDSDETV